MHLNDARSFARNSYWLSLQSEAFKSAFLTHSRLLLLKKNEPLFHMEDSAHDIYCVVEGSCSVSIANPPHGVVVAHLMTPGRWFGEPATLGCRPRVMSVSSRQNSALITVSKEAIKSMLQLQPDFAWNFFNLMAVNVEDYLHHAVDLLIQTPKTRLCSRLLTFGGRLMYFTPNSPVSIPLSQEELAAAANLSRSTVYQILGELVESGICSLGYREIRINNMAALAALVDRQETT